MVKDDSRYLLYIEPRGPKSVAPVRDELTEKMRKLFACSTVARGTNGMPRVFRGVHVCSCGARSSNKDHVIPGGLQTNSLCVHYLEWHRDEVPQSEIEKLKSVME